MAAMLVVLQHLLNLLEAAWSSTVESMSTSTLAIFVTLVVFFARAVYTHGFAFVRAHLKQTLGEGALWAVGAWLVLFAFNIAKNVYNDHQRLVQNVQQATIAAANAAKPVPPKLVGLGWACETSGIPTETPPHSTIWMLPVAFMKGDPGAGSGLWSGFEEAGNGGDKPIPTFPAVWLKELKTPMDRFKSLNSFNCLRCEVRNSGREPFLNVVINFTYEFTTGGSKEEMSKLCSRRYAVIISQINPGTPFVFYAVSQTKAWAHFSFPPVATLELPDSTPEIVAMRPIGTNAWALFPLQPNNIQWNMRPPEDKDECQKSPQAQEKH
jgi:hypothetical protein